MHVFVVLLLAATSERPKLIVQDVVPGAGVDGELARSLSASIAAELQRRGVHEVLTSSDLSTALGQERQRQLLGCSDEATSCLAELADAMGARFVVTGSLVRLGEAWQLTLQTVDTRSARAIGRAVRLAKEPAELVQGFPFTVSEAAGLAPPEQPSRLVPSLLIGAGAAAVIGGGVVLLQTVFRERELATELRLADENPAVLRPAAAYDADVSSLNMQRTMGWVLLGGGAALAAAGTAWLVLSSPSSPKLAVVATPGAAFVALSGELP